MSRGALHALTAAFFGLLSVTLLVAPGLIWWTFGMEGGADAAVMGRRAAMLFAGLAVICAVSRHEGGRAVPLGIAAAMGGLAVLGLAEWARGAVGPGIAVAVAVELALVLLWLRA